MSAQQPPREEPQGQTRQPEPDLKPSQQPQLPKLIEYKGHLIVPEPEKPKRHPLVSAALAILKLPITVLLEWPTDLLDYVEQGRNARHNRKVQEKAERDARIRRLFPPPEKPKKSQGEG